jgi:PBP1b-binding outer membrane lipoprotein LpoB
MNEHLSTRTLRLLSAALAAVALTACSTGDTAAEAEEPPSPEVQTESAEQRSSYDCQRVATGSYC